MGLSGISPLSLLIILAIIIVLFGSKRIKHLGRDLGHAVKGFREGMNQAEQAQTELENDQDKKE